MPAERQTAGRAVYYHQREINDQGSRQPTSGEWQVRAAIQNESSESADGELESEKRHFAVREQARHQLVSLAGDIQVHPEQCELSVKPVQTKQQQAFGECAHGEHLCANVVEPRPYYAETPKLVFGGS